MLNELVSKEDVCNDFSDMLPPADSIFDRMVQDEEAIEVACILYNDLLNYAHRSGMRSSRRMKMCKRTFCHVVRLRTPLSINLLPARAKRRRRLRLILKTSSRKSFARLQASRHRPHLSAAERYKRVDHHLRHVLMHRNAPWVQQSLWRKHLRERTATCRV